MVYCVVMVGKGQREGILCGEVGECAAEWYIVCWGLGKGSLML
jgi:hypothetical protein